MRILFFSLLILSLAGCAWERTTGITEVRRGPYKCQPGEVEGPSLDVSNLETNGILGGHRLKADSPIARGTVFVMQRHSLVSETSILCTGTLIGKNIVLTAAHCVDFGSPRSRMRRTELIFDTDPACAVLEKRENRFRKVEEIKVHPDWDGDTFDKTRGGDLALIRFEDEAPDETKPIVVAPEYVSLSQGQSVYVAGYGRIVDWGEADNEVPYLRVAELKAQMSSPALGIENVKGSKRMVVDQSGGQGVCRGDSGGPALTYNHGVLSLIGVASYVDDPNSRETCKSYGIHTNLDYYRDWLTKTYDQMMDNESSENPFRAKPGT